MKCDLCNKETPDRQAIDDGWEPTYLIDGEEVGDPICAECCRDRCQETPDGPELLPVRVLTSKPRNLANPIDSPYGRYLPPTNLFSRGR